MRCQELGPPAGLIPPQPKGEDTARPPPPFRFYQPDFRQQKKATYIGGRERTPTQLVVSSPSLCALTPTPTNSCSAGSQGQAGPRGPQGPPGAAAVDLADLVSRVKDSVVKVKDPMLSWWTVGTGFFVAPSCSIVTARHVVEEVDSDRIARNLSVELQSGQVVAVTVRYDLAARPRII